jgi:hypothetical protein
MDPIARSAIATAIGNRHATRTHRTSHAHHAHESIGLWRDARVRFKQARNDAR